eukprot:TRINITY_DN2351_c0_g1_i2.p1 TRINITY_DN2351_c0_g1~~TRINITY_DN2351_c0_g1_i2.p1  ORF type:complete len:292 (+),score=20.70 TRINITY_DN2351_c0_g1_i2:56-931(+)
MTSAIPDSAGKAGFDDRWPMPANVAIVPENPQTRAMMTVIRDRRTQTATFRRFADRIVRVCIEYALSFLPTSDIAVTTPTDAEFDGLAFQGRVCGVSIMRAGECMEPALRICCPGVRMGTILIQRDENSADKGPDIRFQYRHLPKDIASRHVLLMDPMLATGGTVHRAIEQLEELGVPLQNIIFVNIISSRTGLHRLARTYPKVRWMINIVDGTMFVCFIKRRLGEPTPSGHRLNRRREIFRAGFRLALAVIVILIILIMMSTFMIEPLTLLPWRAAVYLRVGEDAKPSSF